MNNKGISYRLNWTITSIAIIIIAAIGYINHHFSDEVLMEKIQEGAIHQSNLVVSKISRITVGTEEITRNIASMAMYFHQKKELDQFLDQVLFSNKILENIQIELLDDQKKKIGWFSANRSNDTICSPKRVWDDEYIGKLQSGKIVPREGTWSDPFYCQNDTANLYVSYKLPICYPGSQEIAGLVSCEVSLGKIRQMLSEIKIGKEGFAYIIDRSGELLTHPNKKWNLQKNFFDDSSPFKSKEIKDIQVKLQKDGRGAGFGISETLNNRECWIYFAPLSNANWTLVIVFPEEELFKAHDWTLAKTLIVSVVGILVLFLLNMVIFKRFLDPLARVASAIQRFTSVPGKAGKTKNEIKMLAESLEDWQIKYGKLMREQIKTAKEKEKFENDLKSAYEIQQNILPTGYPAFANHPEVDIFAVLKPAESIGGDLYDYYFIDNEHLLIAIGDVSGKGIPASLFMAIASTLIKSNSKILSSHEIIEKVNNELGDRNPNQYFLTLFVAILNVNTGVMDYCNAAHNYPYILHSDGTMRTLSKSHGIPLGIYKNKTYKSSTIELQEGDLLLLYTDGVINSRNLKGIHYGIEKLISKVLEMNELNSKEVVNRLMESIAKHEAGRMQADDISIVALRYLYKTKDQV